MRSSLIYSHPGPMYLTIITPEINKCKLLLKSVALRPPLMASQTIWLRSFLLDFLKQYLEILITHTV
jgi:hypothetical protein